ncbi:MAG TPA: hypothetical protein VE398_16065 [Acidobacteriota bacterium]|nr:hypothetical protein [Acidobacteriota bacterium]
MKVGSAPFQSDIEGAKEISGLTIPRAEIPELAQSLGDSLAKLAAKLAMLGSTIETSASGQRIVMNSSNITSHDASNPRGRMDVDGIFYGNEYRGDLLLSSGVRPRIDMSTGDHIGLYGGGAPGVLVILSSGLARLCATENVLSNADLSLESFKTTDAVIVKRSTTEIARFNSSGLVMKEGAIDCQTNAVKFKPRKAGSGSNPTTSDIASGEAALWWAADGVGLWYNDAGTMRHVVLS